MRSSRSGTRALGRAAAGVLLVAVAAAGGTAAAAQLPDEPPDAAASATAGLVDEIALPVGFKPEGIAIGDRPVAYFGSQANGAILRADLRSGRSAVIGAAPGTPAVGLKLDRRGRLFVAGGSSGTARVVDSATGRVLATYDLTDEASSFVNDVVLTPAGAYFTESARLVLYHLPIGADGALPTADEVEQIPLSGDIAVADGPLTNGIERTPDGRKLIVVQTRTGLLFSVDPATGRTTRITVAEPGGDGLVPGGDGLLLDGRRLFVVQNRQNLLTAVDLNATATTGTVAARIADERFDVPTTVAAFRGSLFLPNARGFDDEVNDQTVFNAVRVARP